MAKAIKPTTPAVPGVARVEDRAARAALQALADTRRVREGGGAEGFVRRGELKDMAPGVVEQGLLQLLSGAKVGGGSGGSLSDGDSVPGIVGDLIDALSREIENSYLWQRLGERIERITGENGRALQLIRRLQDGVTRELSEQRTRESATISLLEGIKVTVDGNIAAIAQEQSVRASEDEALAQQITTLIASVGDNTAAIQNEQTARANADSALAQDITTLQTGVGNNSAAISSEMSTRISADNQIRTHRSVRIDTNGWMSGYGLIGTQNGSANPTSAFYIRADRFAIGNPAAPAPSGTTPPAANIPFVVQTTPTTAPGTGAPIPAGVYIKKAFIKSADIDTLKIAGRAITVPVFDFVVDQSTTSLTVPITVSGLVPGEVVVVHCHFNVIVFSASVAYDTLVNTGLLGSGEFALKDAGNYVSTAFFETANGSGSVSASVGISLRNQITGLRRIAIMVQVFQR